MTYKIGLGNFYLAKLNTEGEVVSTHQLEDANLNAVVGDKSRENKTPFAVDLIPSFTYESTAVSSDVFKLFQPLTPPQYTFKILYRRRINWMGALLLLGRPDLARWFHPYWYISRVTVEQKSELLYLVKAQTE